MFLVSTVWCLSLSLSVVKKHQFVLTGSIMLYFTQTNTLPKEEDCLSFIISWCDLKDSITNFILRDEFVGLQGKIPKKKKEERNNLICRVWSNFKLRVRTYFIKTILNQTKKKKKILIWIWLSKGRIQLTTYSLPKFTSAARFSNLLLWVMSVIPLIS